MQQASKQACIQVFFVLQYFFIALMTSIIKIGCVKHYFDSA